MAWHGEVAAGFFHEGPQKGMRTSSLKTGQFEGPWNSKVHISHTQYIFLSLVYNFSYVIFVPSLSTTNGVLLFLFFLYFFTAETAGPRVLFSKKSRQTSFLLSLLRKPLFLSNKTCLRRNERWRLLNNLEKCCFEKRTSFY